MRAATSSRLPPDGQSAGLARRQVRKALAEAGLEALLDEALLLVTELVTNAVIHAGTEIDLRLDTTANGLRAEIADQGSAPLPIPRSAVEETREGGRGLFLLDTLATSWGTSHFPGGKSVWFELGDRPASSRWVETPLADARAGERSVDWLVGLPAPLEEQLTAVQLVQELVHRLVEGLGVDGASVLVDHGSDQSSWRVLVAIGSGPSPETVEQVRRIAGAPSRVLTQPGLLVLPLRLDSYSFGALLLEVDKPDREAAALGRLVADRIGTVLHEARTREARLRSRSSLALLAEASEMFAGSLDVTLATTLLAQLVVPRFAGWSAVFTQLDGASPQLVAVLDADEKRVARLRVLLSTTAAGSVATDLMGELAAGRPVLRPGPTMDFAELAIGDVLAVPLMARRRLLGMLLVSRQDPSSYTSDEVGVLLDLCRRAALAVANARLYEERTAVAQALQASLLPPVLPVVDGLDFGARYAATGEGNEVGGDFYDVFPVLDGGWAVAIGDVCGKGPQAAAITGLARSVLRLLTEEGRPADEAFGRLNRAILDLGDRGRFCTTALATLHPEAAGVRVRLSSAGHPPPALLRSDGTVEFPGGGGTLVGVIPDLDVITVDLMLAPGEQLIFYTDGVTERRDGARWFGEESLVRVLSPLAGRPADLTAGQVEQSVRDFAAQGATDDLAVLVVRASSGQALGRQD